MPRGDKGGKSNGSGIRYVAANCGNTNADGVSLHTFPKDPTHLKKMERFRETKKGATTPSKSSSTQSLIPSTPAAQSHLTTENRLQLLSPSEDIEYQNFPPKKIRRGYMKREAARVSIK